MAVYRAEYIGGDNDFRIIHSDTDEQAIAEAFESEVDDMVVCGLFLLDEDYNEVRSIF